MTMMKNMYKLIIGCFAVVLFAACEKESDLLIGRTASPVLLVTTDGTSSVTAFFYELDKSGILDQTIGIDSIPVVGLSVEVFARGASMGSFETGADGSFTVDYTTAKPNEYAGQYKGIAFRVFK